MSFALITGASKGIGKAIAANLAARKSNLLLVARSERELQQTANDLSSRFGVQCNYFVADLSQNDSPKKIFDWVRTNKYEMSVLVNNAGFGLWGPFHELPLDEQNEMIAVNISALVNLTHLFMPQLLNQEKAYILNVASGAGYQSIPTFGVYSGTKSFVLLFTRALHHELKHTNVSVSCLSPGTVKTNFVDRARMQHMQELSDKMSMSAEAVADAAVKGMLAGKIEIMPGFVNRLGVFLTRFVPKSVVEKAAGNIYRKKDGAL
jgi:uncharacterized protein